MYRSAGDVELEAISGADLRVAPGEFVALIGPFRLRQDNATEDYRRSYQADRGNGSRSWSRTS